MIGPRSGYRWTAPRVSPPGSGRGSYRALIPASRGRDQMISLLRKFCGVSRCSISLIHIKGTGARDFQPFVFFLGLTLSGPRSHTLNQLLHSVSNSREHLKEKTWISGVRDTAALMRLQKFLKNQQCFRPDSSYQLYKLTATLINHYFKEYL